MESSDLLVLVVNLNIELSHSSFSYCSCFTGFLFNNGSFRLRQKHEPLTSGQMFVRVDQLQLVELCPDDFGFHPV